MLAEYSKKFEYSLTALRASICPASSTAGRAAVKQTEPFQHKGWFFTQEDKKQPPKTWKTTVISLHCYFTLFNSS